MFSLVLLYQYLSLRQSSLVQRSLAISTTKIKAYSL